MNSLISAINVRPEEKELFVQQEVPVYEEQGRQVRGWLRSGTWVSKLFPSVPFFCTFCACSLAHIYCVLRVFSRHMYPPILMYRIVHILYDFEPLSCEVVPRSKPPRFHNRWTKFLLMIHVLYKVESTPKIDHIKEKYFFVLWSNFKRKVK